MLNRIAGENTVYNMPSVIQLKRNYDIEVIEAAFRKVIERHESLRTAFFISKGKIVQRVFSSVDFYLEQYILEKDSDIKKIVEEFVRPFSLEKAPLLRGAILKKNGIQYLLLDMHHIISDGKSENILMNEIYHFADGEELLPLTIQYKDWVKEEISLLCNEKYMKRAREFWLNAFQEVYESLNLPTDFPRPEVQQFNGDRKVFTVSKELTKKVRSVCERYKVTLNHFLLAIYAVTLSKLSNQEDIVIGTPVSARRNSEQEQVIGLFLNTLPIRCYPKFEKTFLQFLNEVKRFSLMAMKYQNYTLDMLVKDVKFPKELSRNPVFDVAFLYNSNIVIDAENSEIYYRTNNAKVDLSMEITNSNNQIQFLLEYCTNLYKPETCEKFGDLFIRVLEQVSNDVKIQIGQIEKLTEIEKNQVLHEWNQTKYDYDKKITINHLLVNQRITTPHKKALVCEGECVTYEELERKVNQFASYLRSRNIRRNHIVAIMMNPGIEMVVAILGVIRAGAAYLPIAYNTPEQRVNYILEDSGAKLLILDEKNEKLNNVYIYNQSELSSYSDQVECINESDDLMYVIYTSGSTGNPKGVMVKHGNVVNFRYGMVDAVNMEKHKKILLLTTTCFDISVLEMIIPLTLGMEVVIVKKAMQQNMRAILQSIKENGIDMLQFTPSRFQMLTLVPDWEEKFSNVKTLLIGGEAFPKAVLDKVLRLKNTRTFNVYGPTETTIWSTIEIIHDAHITIGKPIANTQIYILDKNKQCVGIGETGEIYIAGDGVTKGYCNNKKLTDEKFVNNPYTGNVMYETGDLGKWNSDGKIECLGRIDFQVKIRGYRIEVGEIEQQIRKYNGVDDAVVVDYSMPDGNKYLCAYITGKVKEFHGLKGYLEKQLPEYMIPSFFAHLDEIPLNNNGKINRKMLPEPSFNKKMDFKKKKELTSTIELKIQDIWKKVLNVDEIDVDEDFFDLGGNSLLAIKADLLFEQEKIRITGQNIYRYRTIRKLSKFLEDSAKTENDEHTENDVIDYANDSIVINGIEPYNDLFFRSCFYNSLFAILTYYGIDITDLLKQYKSHYECIMDAEKMKILAKGDWVKEILPILKRTGVKFVSSHSVENVVEKTKDAIKNGIPVILWIDCFYESYRQDKYKKEHFNHTITVYGYSEQEQVFYILEHKIADNTNYHKITIPFDEMERCYKGYLECFNEEDSYYEIDREKEMNLLILSKEEFLESNWEKKIVIQWKEYFEKIEYERVQLEDILYYIDGMNKLILCLQADVVKYKYHTRLADVEKRLHLWKGLRNLLLRSYYLEDYSKNMHLKNLDVLDEILALEDKFD